MVNVSRFNAVQQHIEDEIRALCKELSNSIELNANDLSLTDENFKSFETLYFQGASNRQFSFQGAEFSEVPYGSCEETEDLDYHKDIIPSLLEVCREIEVQTVNMQTGSLTYPDPEDRSRHVIAIWGLALSRGLTLEGLSITYILRNASASDTLMQMGRWFGYRSGYKNLTRIFMPEISYDHYCSIHIATEELRQELETMEAVNKTPLDFGLKVRNSDTGILITARNKLQSAETISFSKDFSSSHKQAYILTKDKDVRKNNEDEIISFIRQNISQKTYEEIGGGYTFEVAGDAVLKLLRRLNFTGDQTMDPLNLEKKLSIFQISLL